jgi:hypothetical protein
VDNKSPKEIEVEFPQNPEQGVPIRVRRTPDLPEQIVGKARWNQAEHARRSSYLLKINDKWWPIEFINKNWYYLTWHEKTDAYWVSSEDKINSPALLGLGTPSAPYQVRGDEVKSEDKTPATKEPVESRGSTSDPDTPVATREEAQVVEELSTHLEQTSVGPVPFWTDESLAEQEDLADKYPPALTHEQLQRFEKNFDKMTTQTQIAYASTQTGTVAGPSATTPAQLIRGGLGSLPSSIPPFQGGGPAPLAGGLQHAGPLLRSAPQTYHYPSLFFFFASISLATSYVLGLPTYSSIKLLR